MSHFLLTKQINYKKKYKEKLKDRHKINGIKFDYSKKERRKNLILFNNKSQEKIKREKLENLIFNDYNKLKHQIFIKEKKEKDKSKEAENNNKNINAFNYTNITNIIEKFLSTTNYNDKNNPFNYNLKRGKMAIDQMNRNIKKNRINASLKKIVLHFRKIKSKLGNDIIINNEKYLSEEMAETIKNKIESHRKKMKLRNFMTSKNNTMVIDSNLYNYTSNSTNLINNKFKRTKINTSNFYENSNISNINSNFNLSSCRPFTKKNINIKKNKNGSSIQLYSYLIHPDDKNRKNAITLKDELINKNFNKEETLELSKENKLKSENKSILNNKKKGLAFNASKLSHYFTLSLTAKKLRDKNKNAKEKYGLFTDDYNTIGLMKKSNSNYIKKTNFENNSSTIPKSNFHNIKFKKNFKFNDSSIINKKLQRCSSSIKRKSFLKVKNLPIYMTNINDFINEYNRIKRNIKKLKKNYEERHFTTFKEIDRLLKTKEDMLMFLLKQKFLNSKLKPKPSKDNINKKEFINKIKDYVDLIEEKPQNIYLNLEDIKL